MFNVQTILELYKEGKVKESTIIKMAAFKEEIKEHLNGSLTKEAKFDVGTAFLTLAAIPAMAAGKYLITKSVDYAEKGSIDLKNERYFKNMLDMRPELKNEDQLIVRKYWDSLIHFAPIVAKDPLAAGAYIKQSMEYEGVGGPPYSTIKSLVDTQKAFKDAQPSKATTMGDSIAGTSLEL